MGFSGTIRRIYDALEADRSFGSMRSDALFRELVEAVTASPEAPHDLTDEEVSRLRAWNGRRESAFERAWAGRIIASDDPVRALEAFPFLKNYAELAKLEWSALERCRTHGGHRVLFCGGGPLPLTAIALARDLDVASTVIDNDADAVRTSRNVIGRLGLSGRVRIVQADARRYRGYGRFNAIFVAALVGLSSDEKARVFSRINGMSKEPAHVIVRSGSGNRGLLYLPIGQEVLRYLTPVLHVGRRADVGGHHYFVSVDVMKTHAQA